MNRKISLGMAVTIVILAMTVTFSITMLIAMRSVRQHGQQRKRKGKYVQQDR